MMDLLQAAKNGNSGDSKLHTIPTEAVITSHHVFSLNINDNEGVLNILHRDLFDSRKEVVISALHTLQKFSNEKSVSFIVRLLKHKEEDVRRKAVESLGEMREQKLLPTLIDMFKTSHDEQLRFRVLEALLKIDQDEPEVKTLLRAYAASPVISGAAKANAIELLLKYDNDTNIDYFLKDPSIKEDIIEKLTKICGDVPKIRSSLINYGINKWNSLTVIQKGLMIKVASPYSLKEEKDILMHGLLDIHPDVRKTCYQNIGITKNQKAVIGNIIRFLIDGAETNVDAEDEAIQCIHRIENMKRETEISIDTRYINDIENNIDELFQQLTKESRRVMSDSHELGWFIVHGKEYIEFYCDDGFKQEIINYLKKSSNYSMDELLFKLKNSAVRVEVGHFNGYNALRDLIKKPNRNGIALIARELALAKTGKRNLMSKLIRLLYMTRLFSWKDKKQLSNKIYEWAFSRKFFRLAEAALYAMKICLPNLANHKIKENITLPIASKILVLASIKLLEKDEWPLYKNEISQLLSKINDPYITLAIINILDNKALSINTELQTTLLQRMIKDNNEEVISRISYLLGKKADVNIIESIMNFYDKVDRSKKLALLNVLESLAVNNKLKTDIGLNEFLYKILREEKNDSIKIYALTILYKIGDSYSYKAVKDFLEDLPINEKSLLISNLKDLSHIDVNFITRLLVKNNSHELHLAFRNNINLLDDEYKRMLYDQFINMRSDVKSIVEDGESIVSEVINNAKIDFSEEKKAFQFEHEHLENLTVVFTDIEGYTHKSLTLTEMELASLIKDYESILIPIFNQHMGKLIKRIGDGHLFVFKKPLYAVLGALRFEKALKRFNDFREEKLKITARVGIHYGQVIQENGDILGNTVNLASRLEESAAGGRIFISDIIYNAVKDYIHMNEIGKIKVKGVDNPVMVYEPYEIMVSMPKDLDPANKKYMYGNPPSNNSFTDINSNEGTDINIKITHYIKHTFSVIYNMCLKAEKGEIEISVISNELRRRWALLSKALG